MPTLTCAAFSPVHKAFFGFFEGESDGYMYKAQPYPEIEEQVRDMLNAEPDLSVKAVTFGLGQWLVHAQHEDKPPTDREFVMFKNYDAFSKGVNERVKNGRALRCAHCESNIWAAYFEGRIEGKCATVVADSTAEMLTGLETQVSDNELSLECIVYGEGAWFSFFLEHPSHEQGDTKWVVNAKYAGDGSFQTSLAENCDADVSLRKVCFGDKVWFGYWEGTVAETAGWAWHSDPSLQGFLDKIKSEWEADDEEGAAAAAAATAASNTDNGDAAKDTSSNADATAAKKTTDNSGGDGPKKSADDKPANNHQKAPTATAAATTGSSDPTKSKVVVIPPVPNKVYKTEGGVDWGTFAVSKTELPGPLTPQDVDALKSEWSKKFATHEAKFQKGVTAATMTEKIKNKLMSDAQKDFDKIVAKASKLSTKFVKAEEKRLAKEAKIAKAEAKKAAKKK